jgi:hypothetical protein
MNMKETVKPSDFETEEHMFNSPFQNTEKEIVARNLILLSKWNDDKWLDFTWEEYREKCEHRVTDGEHSVLNKFVQEGLLSRENGKYSIQDKFIKTLAQFIK